MKFVGLPSLRVQTIAILTIGLVLSHMIGLWLYSLDRKAAVADTEALDVAERAAGVIVLIRNVPEDWRINVLSAADSRSFRVWLTDASVVDEKAATDDDEQVLAYLRTLLPRLVDRDMRVSIARPEESAVKPPVRTEPPGAPTASAFDSAAKFVFISIHHPEGFWLNFMGAVPKPATNWPGAFSIYIFTTVIGVGVIAFWLVQRVTKPFEEFAEAADRLGKDIRALPLNLRGPKEVAQATAAFNRMQERISRLVENRVELLAAISHDLRTPITRMKLQAELLDDAEMRENFAKSLVEMESIMATFLDYARSSFGSEQRSRVELSSLVESICSDYADSGCAVEFKQAPPLYIGCKRSAVRRAVNNIVENAIKYAGGAEVSVVNRSGAGAIIVEDNGPGVPESEFATIVMPFHRGDPSRNKETGGVGLGLSIAQAIAHDHGGELVLSNRETGGLRVEIELPE